MTDPPVILAVGEMLWDLFPTGNRLLGGAPANFAVHCAALGAVSQLVSCVGNDSLGPEALLALCAHRVDTRWIQVDARHPTGTVAVTLTKGQPSYQIVEKVAWDQIVWRDELEALARTASAVCFGTLAQRAEISRQTIQRLVAARNPDSLCMVDVNFRQHHHCADVVQRSLALANAVKLNLEEAHQLRSYIDGPADMDLFLKNLVTRFCLRFLVLTLGSRGCRIYSEKIVLEIAGRPQVVKNAVGAGDAFTAAFICQYLKGEDLESCAIRANAIGGFVSTQESATPVLPESFRIFP
jgi:fructokinase